MNDEVTKALLEAVAGSKEAENRLFDLVHNHLRKLAGERMQDDKMNDRATRLRLQVWSKRRTFASLEGILGFRRLSPGRTSMRPRLEL